MAGARDGLRLDKMIKPFANKFVQIILQSRLNTKPQTKIPPPSGAMGRMDPFGITIEELPYISAEVKELLAQGFDDGILCVDVSLMFSDGESVKLENWTMESKPRKFERRIFDVHSRMGLMLKSILAITRTLPAYQMLKNLDNEPYNVCYKIYLGSSTDSDLGDEYKTFRFSRLHCGCGSVLITVSYRTKLVKTWKKIDIVKDDEPTTKPRIIVNFDEPMKVPAFVDINNYKRFDGSEFNLPEFKDLNWLYKFFLAQDSACDVNYDTSNEDQTEEEVVDHFKDVKSIWSFTEDEDKFEKALNLPFANTTVLSELASFYRYFNRPPALEIFDRTPEDQDNISLKLRLYESNIREYDNMIEKLYD